MVNNNNNNNNNNNKLGLGYIRFKQIFEIFNTLKS